MNAESKSSSLPQEPHQYLNLDVTPQKCDKDNFPASNENFHEMASAEELMGGNIPFSYPKEEAWGTRDLLQGKRWGGHVTYQICRNGRAGTLHQSLLINITSSS